MGVTRLNHAVLYVNDVAATRTFYEEVLGFQTLNYVEGRMAFFRAPGSTNDHDLGTFQVGPGARPSLAGRGSVGLYHLAWEVDTLAELLRIRGLLQARGALVGATDHVTTKALYAKDPDGIEFEVSWLVPASLITPEMPSLDGMAALDLEGEIARYGAQTRGGLGISIPLGVTAP